MKELVEQTASLVVASLPMLSALIVVLKKYNPQVDSYFQTGSIILAEVDDILDKILLEYPDSPTLNKVDDVIEKLLTELKEAGYQIDQSTKSKIENRVKGQLKRDNKAKVSWRNGEWKLEREG
ncbi:hypothetical protein Halha_2164 [Halobacteroides halobius DSM 5150]|uniref:Uncharacterized protein n=1 Tax=Halobacteroides halobius (strain ATCC 35273 / DSM 5150 / MD-1) TaxID=748449 RepID=L0K9R3_HALHC|nr:hypothetical protein [Halobacteroides halobius]AGB42047.1 hypothetical protein Halha_2164 [Halobacteroides halobius DSM 5150]